MAFEGSKTLSSKAYVQPEARLPFSMTGFGEAEGPVAGGILRVEIRSVNHRFFNLSARLPADLVVFEADFRERLRREFERGHLSVSVRWLSSRARLDRLRAGPERCAGSDRALAGAAGRARNDGRDPARSRGAPAGGLLARRIRLRLRDSGRRSSRSSEKPLPGAVRREGARARCWRGSSRTGWVFCAAASRVAELAPARLLRERDRLRAAVAELLVDRKVDDQRLAQEIAFLAERLDITEELVRLDAHLDACGQALREDGPAGKRLGFLAQELGREINTIGSKANDAAMQHAVVEMKGELERFREQLENLE